MKKIVAWLLLLGLIFTLCACKKAEPENIVEDVVGPEGIDDFAGLWYAPSLNLWIEIYYTGDWCSFETGGVLRSSGVLTISGSEATLEPTLEGEDHFIIVRSDSGLRLSDGGELYAVTEVSITKPMLVNDRGVEDLLPRKDLEGTVDPDFSQAYEGFYISEDGIYAIEIFEDGSFELQEYGMIIEKGEILRLSKPASGELYTNTKDSEEGRLIFSSEERLYIGGIGTFTPGEKAEPSDE